jgi:hypothetical protein
MANNLIKTQHVDADRKVNHIIPVCFILSTLIRLGKRVQAALIDRPCMYVTPGFSIPDFRAIVYHDPLY